MAASESYAERYVAFMDVLGFSQLVRDADDDDEKREVIRGVIRTLRETFNEVPASADFRFTQFSDCIVLSADRSRDGLLAVFTGCVSLAGGLMAEGVLLRGGIAVGKLTHTEDTLFGTGLLKAYSGDASGSPPRISLCDRTFSDAETFQLVDLTRQDPMDLTMILNTLWEYEGYVETESGNDALAARGYSVVTHIQLSSMDMSLSPSVRAKWRWLRVYWNESMQYRSSFPQVI